MLIGGAGNDSIKGGDLNEAAQIAFNIVVHNKDMFGNNHTWGDERYEREIGDVDGDGQVDVVAFAHASVENGLSGGDGTIALTVQGTTAFGVNMGWGDES